MTLRNEACKNLWEMEKMLVCGITPQVLSDYIYTTFRFHAQLH